MEPIPQYIYVWSATLDDLELQVNAKAAEGYKTNGPLLIVPVRTRTERPNDAETDITFSAVQESRCYQPMVKI